MKKVYLSLILVCLCIAGHAQTAASYSFSTLIDPFVSIGGTGTEVFSIETDDFTEVGIPIPFPFTYCGVPYTSFSACSNGWASLSMTPATYCLEYINSSLNIDDGDIFGMGTPPGTGAGWLMPFWYDMNGTSEHAYYTTIGVAPNRIFIFEWNNWTDIGGVGNMSFQVKLHETTNIIDFCYGPPSTESFLFATIGIANDQVSDWQTLSDAGPSPSASTTFVDFIDGSPADGQVYRWSPPTCTPPAITGTFSLCAGATNTLADATPGGTWSSSVIAVGTINSSTGKVTGITAGTTVITYSTGTSCYITAVVTVNAATPITGTASVCQGFTTTLSSGPSGGTWGTGLSSIATVDASGVVTGALGGTTTATYTTSTGCTATIVVTVNPNPAPITGASGMCVGTTTTLTSTTAGGTWTSGTPPIATVGLTTGIVTAGALGTSVITYMLPTTCYATAVVTVNTSVSPITGSPVVCVGTTTTLNSTTTGGTWSSSNSNASVAVATGVVTGSTVGTSTITYSLGGGCFTTITVTVNASPSAITGVFIMCQGQTSALAHAIGGGTWISSAPGTASVGLATGIVTGGATAGTATITYTLPAASGSCTVTKVVTVNPNPNPITGSLSVCLGKTTTLSSTSPSMTWNSSNASVAPVGATTGVVSGLATGTATITGTSGGCSISVVVTVNPLPSTITGTSTVCVGFNTTLSSSPFGGTWSSSLPPIASVPFAGIGTVNGNAAGTAVITYTLPTTCLITDVVTVNVNPGTITGIPTVCIGLTTSLSSSPLGGTWVSTNATIAPVSTTGVVTGIGPAGTTMISYTLGTGCFKTQAVTVSPVPAAITGPTSLCPTTTVTLNSTTAGGAWTSLSPGTATVVSGTGVVTGVATGFATINYTLPTGCLASVIVTVTTAPPAVINALGDTAICPGGFVTLTASTSAGVTYEWYESGAFIGVTTSTYLTSTPGSYQVKVSLPAGCSITSVPMSVSVLPATAAITLPGGSTGCSGTGVALDGTAGAGISYQWMTGPSAPIAGATGASYTATVSGTYYLNLSNSTGCSALSAPVSVSVTPDPLGLVTLSGPLNLCAGSTITMTAAAGLTYQWFNVGGAIFAATNASYTTGSADNYYVVETNALGCTATSAISVVNVNPLPDATITYPAGATVFCIGGNLNFNAIAAGGQTYQWYKSGVAIASATSSTYTATLTGSYQVRVTNTATGCSALSMPAVPVTVVSSPVVSPLTPSRFCWGGSSLLSTSVSSVGTAVGYQWFLNGVAISGASGSTYNATIPGNYSCTISVSGSCIVSTNTIPVVENPLPDPLITFNGTAFHTGNFYVTYQWYKNLALIPGATSSGTPATGNGNYKVDVTDTNGCQSVSTNYVLAGWNGSSVAVTDLREGEVRIYPNPARSIVHVESIHPVKAVIASIDGRLLLSVDAAKDIDISKLANGIYMIMIYDAEMKLLKTDKLIKAGE